MKQCLLNLITTERDEGGVLGMKKTNKQVLSIRLTYVTTASTWDRTSKVSFSLR